MSSGRYTKSVRILCAFGAGFAALGWALHALTTLVLPAVDSASFRMGAILIGLMAGAGSFVLARILRPKELEREHQLNRSILANAAHSIVSTDLDGRVRAFSSGAEKLLGFHANEVIGRLNCEVFHLPSELVERARELSLEFGHEIAPGFAVLVARTDAADEREWTYVRQDGSRVPVRVSMTAMRDRHGDVTGYLAIANDVTQQRLAEEGRRELDTRLTRIASQVPGMVFQFRQGPDGRQSFPYASDGIRQFFHLEPEDVAADSSAVWSVIHPEDVDRVAGSIAESVTSLKRWECELRTRFPDGTEH